MPAHRRLILEYEGALYKVEVRSWCTDRVVCKTDSCCHASACDNANVCAALSAASTVRLSSKILHNLIRIRVTRTNYPDKKLRRSNQGLELSSTRSLEHPADAAFPVDQSVPNEMTSQRYDIINILNYTDGRSTSVHSIWTEPCEPTPYRVREISNHVT